MRKTALLQSLHKCVPAQMVDVHGEFKNTVVITRDGVNAENAGAIFCHLIGEERVFEFARCIKVLRRRPPWKEEVQFKHGAFNCLS